MLKKFALSTAFVVAMLAPVMASGAPAANRTELQRWEIPNTNYVAINFAITLDPGAAVPLHTHPGVEMMYVIEGTLTVSVKGEPDKVIKAGEYFQIDAGLVHSGSNNGQTPVRGVQTYVVEKDKSLATPVK